MIFFDKLFISAMIKLSMIMIVFTPSVCFAEVSGYIYMGKYGNSTYRDLEGRDIGYRAGIHLDYKKNNTTLFVEDETLIRSFSRKGAHPKQINYKVGLRQKINNAEIIFQHECLHLIDGWSSGNKAISYNLIEGRFNF